MEPYVLPSPVPTVPAPSGRAKRCRTDVKAAQCGKTSLLSVFAMGEFPQEYEPTIFEVRSVGRSLARWGCLRTPGGRAGSELDG